MLLSNDRMLFQSPYDDRRVALIDSQRFLHAHACDSSVGGPQKSDETTMIYFTAIRLNLPRCGANA